MPASSCFRRRSASTTTSGQQIGQVFGARFNRDHFAHFEIPSPDIAHDDSVFGFTFDFYNDLSAVGEIAGLRVILQPTRQEFASIKLFEKSKDFPYNFWGTLRDSAKILHSLIKERDVRV